jgi:hypothetical protein
MPPWCSAGQISSLCSPVWHRDVVAGEGQMAERIVPVVDNVERRALPPRVSGRCQPLAPC